MIELIETNAEATSTEQAIELATEPKREGDIALEVLDGKDEVAVQVESDF